MDVKQVWQWSKKERVRKLRNGLPLFSGIAGGLALVLVVLASLGSNALPASAAPSAQQGELRVCANGCAYTTVQAAIDAAQPGDVIQIASGVYTGTVSRAGQWQMAYITQSLTLRGGYNADFTAWDPALYTTTLDAEGTGRVVYVQGDITVTLEGLRLVNGYHSASGAGVYAESATLHVLSSTIGHNRVNPNFHGNFGVGLYIANGTLMMQNSIVQENEPNPGGDNSHDGGGLYAVDAIVEISDSQFVSNTAAFGSTTWDVGCGGGVFLERCDARIENVTFRGNVATEANGGGGGLWTRSGSLRLLNSTFEGNTNAGAALYTAGALVAGNTFTGNIGNGLAVSSWGEPVINVTVTHNLLQDNTGCGLVVPVRAVSIIVEGNDFIGNDKGGLKLAAKSDTGAATTVIVRDNLFQGNTTTGNGGGAYLTGAVDVLFNRFLNNHANGKGGGVYQEEYCSDPYSSYTCKDNASAVYDGNLFRGNSATEGGGLYSVPKYSDNLNITYRNMAFLDNTATSAGSALYFYRYSYTPVRFEHLTVANNTGGDGTMIYHMMGKAFYTNTILYSGTIGIKRQNDYVTLDHVLRYDVLTPTLNAGVWGLTDLSPITGTPAFAADGYHLTAASAAVDAGIPTGIPHDIDGQPRPLGTAPDLGADESPYSLNANGVQASKVASAPQWKVYYTGINVPPSTYLQQDYLIPYAYYAPATAPQVTRYALHDTFPASLDLLSVSSPPGLSFARNGAALSWYTQAPLLPGEWGWVGLSARSDTATSGDTITNTGQMTYTLANGNSGTLPFSVTVEVPVRPVFPPLFIFPLDGEMCLDEGKYLSASGLAGAGMVVRLYEDGEFKGETTANATGEFTLTWTSALTRSHGVDLYAIACEPGTGTVCSVPSDHVSLTYPQADWCPQRSYWEGDAFGMHHTFFFRNDEGRYAANDFHLPGVYGFWNTQMHLYSCCPHDTINPFKVKADGVIYENPVSHNGRFWTFNIGGAHDVTVESQCYDVGGAEGDPKSTHGAVLIDPDGFVFDVDAGGSYSATTGMYAPVQALAGITVTAYVSVPEWGGWIPWPAHLYKNQVNPQVTGPEGYFAFFTPPGFYYLQVEGANGYQSWRSPVVQVISDIVHVNVPLTRWTAENVAQVALLPDGPHPSALTIPANTSVEWISTLDADATATDLARLNEHPVAQPRTGDALDPLTSTLGFDGGMLAPGRVYRRQFTQEGTYTYTDGLGHTATVVVTATEKKIYLPLVLRNR